MTFSATKSRVLNRGVPTDDFLTTLVTCFRALPDEIFAERQDPAPPDIDIYTKVRPALERGDVVVQDRYLDSSVAYQGAGRVLGGDEVRDVSLWATQGLLPDLTILLDLDESTGRDRLADSRTQYDRLEAEQQDFHARVRAGYLELAAAEPGRFLVLDAQQDVETIASAIRGRVAELLP